MANLPSRPTTWFERFCRGIVRRRRKAIVAVLTIVCVVLAVCLAGPLAVEQLMYAQIRSTLKERLGDDYAILKMHVNGGESLDIDFRHDLMRLIKKVKTQYRSWRNREIKGMASAEDMGRCPWPRGRKHYVALLVSDNEQIYMYYWSYRRFGLLEASVDQITVAPRACRYLYLYEPERRVNVKGMWFKALPANPNVRFYYHQGRC